MIDDGHPMIDFFDPPEPGSPRPFSRATRASGLVFVSGHSAPHDPAHGILRGATPADEVRNALACVSGILREMGSDLDKVVQMTMLISDPADYAACNAEYVKHLPERTARTAHSALRRSDRGEGRLCLYRAGKGLTCESPCPRRVRPVSIRIQHH